MESKQSLLWGVALGLTFLAHGAAAAQALPAAEMDPALWVSAPATAPPPAPATPAPEGQTFTQLSRSAKAAPVAPPGDAPPEGEAHWLLLAGLAALLFIARRYQRHGNAAGPAHGPVAAPARPAARPSAFADLRSDPGH